VAEVNVSPTTGMGRVAWHWFEALRARGHRVTHIGPDQVGPLAHPRHFPASARRVVDRLGERVDGLLVHEPASGAFVDAGLPVVLVSHGIERRLWELQTSGRAGDVPSWRTRLLFPCWRLRLADRGLRRAERLYLISRDDIAFATERYGRQAADIFAFRNGVDPMTVGPARRAKDVLFIGTWISRKGTDLLTHAAEALADVHPDLRWTLAGTGRDAETVAAAFAERVRPRLTLRPHFTAADEAGLFEGAPIFVLPSTFEGQPLALLQAMAAGCCCITTDTCGQRDLIQDGRNGRLVAVGDRTGFTTAIRQVLDDPALRDRLGAAARDSVSTRTWPVVSAEVADDLEMFFSSRQTHA
jgi:glycosyltransferase involved in cell wall biosynthesis